MFVCGYVFVEIYGENVTRVVTGFAHHGAVVQLASVLGVLAA